VVWALEVVEVCFTGVYGGGVAFEVVDLGPAVELVEVWGGGEYGGGVFLVLVLVLFRPAVELVEVWGGGV